MTKYEGLRQAASEARKKWRDQDIRCRQYLVRLASGFNDYAGIPNDVTTYLRLTRDSETDIRYLPADDGRHYTAMGASTFNDVDNYWHLGVWIDLGTPSHGSSMSFAFVLQVQEKASSIFVKVQPSSKAQEVDLSNSQQVNAVVYDPIIEAVRESFTENPASDRVRSLGFSNL